MVNDGEIVINANSPRSLLVEMLATVNPYVVAIMFGEQQSPLSINCVGVKRQ